MRVINFFFGYPFVLLAFVVLSALVQSGLNAGVEGDYVFESSGLYVTITGYNGSDTEISIPSTLGGLPVRGIGDRAFQSKRMTRAVIPEGVESIGLRAFYGCAAMTDIVLSHTLLSIGQDAFSGCFSLTSIFVPSYVSSIHESAFNTCRSMTSIHVDAENPTYQSVGGLLVARDGLQLLVCPRGYEGHLTIPDELGVIVSSAFAGCEKLTRVTLQSGLDTVPPYAFLSCIALEQVDLPAGLKSIENWAFQQCELLESIKLPASLEQIGVAAFSGCLSLSEITIPQGVTAVGGAAFQGCVELSTAVFEGHAPNMSVQVFDGAAVGFSIFHRPGADGFSSPLWLGYPCEMLPNQVPVLVGIGNREVVLGESITFPVLVSDGDSLQSLSYSANGGE